MNQSTSSEPTRQKMRLKFRLVSSHKICGQTFTTGLSSDRIISFQALTVIDRVSMAGLIVCSTFLHNMQLTKSISLKNGKNLSALNGWMSLVLKNFIKISRRPYLVSLSHKCNAVHAQFKSAQIIHCLLQL